VKFDSQRPSGPSICLPLCKESEFVISKITDTRFRIGTRGSRVNNDDALIRDDMSQKRGWHTEVGADQIGPIILALMQVQATMAEAEDGSV
jgi:hypothetical protein